MSITTYLLRLSTCAGNTFLKWKYVVYKNTPKKELVLSFREDWLKEIHVLCQTYASSVIVKHNSPG